VLSFGLSEPVMIYGKEEAIPGTRCGGDICLTAFSISAATVLKSLPKASSNVICMEIIYSES
jgi:hypothetical protein